MRTREALTKLVLAQLLDEFGDPAAIASFRTDSLRLCQRSTTMSMSYVTRVTHRPSERTDVHVWGLDSLKSTEDADEDAQIRIRAVRHDPILPAL